MEKTVAPESRSAKRQLLFGLIVGLAVVLAAEVGLASADEGEQPQTGSITFHPGDNFIGWVAEPVSLARLFQQVPQLSLIYTWDAANEQWRFAGSQVPRSLWSIDRLEPTVAYVIRNATQEPIEWGRSLVPTKGLVKLQEGHNWVAWSGRDGWSITDVARGIGRSLSAIRMGDLVYDHSQPATAEAWPLVRRGDALQVTSTRNVNWLQPTGLLPQVVVTGDVDDRQVAERSNHLSVAVDYFAEAFGIEADPFVLEVHITDAAEHQGFATGSAARLTFPAHATWRPEWAESALSVLVHEYFHALQRQLAPTAPMPTWIVEGGATWIQRYSKVGEPNNTWDWVLDHAKFDCAHVDLRATERRTFGCGYTLGEVANFLLSERYNSEGVVEIWRIVDAVSPQHGVQKWEDAFEQVYGLTAADFYVEFAKWIDEDRERQTQPLPGGRPTVLLEGVVERDDGSPLAGLWVGAYQYRAGSVHYATWALTNDSGQFVQRVFAEDDVKIQVEFENGCALWKASDGVSMHYGEALQRAGSEYASDNILITVPGDACSDADR